MESSFRPLIVHERELNTAVTTEQGWIGSPADHSQVSGIVPITVAAGVTLQSGTLSYYPVDADRQEGNRLGVDGTPFFFVNGHAISGAVDLSTFKKLIDAALKESAARVGR